MPGSTRAGRRADSNDRQQREHRSGHGRHSSTAPADPQTQHAASRSTSAPPFVTSSRYCVAGFAWQRRSAPT